MARIPNYFSISWIFTLLLYSLKGNAQVPVTNNSNFSFGSYGRVGIAWSPALTGGAPRSLNLIGLGSIGGRLEENDYLELAAGLHFTPVSAKKDTTDINVQVRLAFYTSQGQFLGNVGSKSFGGIAVAIPELYAEAKKILGTPFTLWIGARFFRGDDIHIADHFYFDDHSGQGAGIKYKQSHLAVILPGSVDTTSNLPPYFYLNIVNGSPVLGLRSRTVVIGEQTFTLGNNQQLKFLGEYHRLAKATVNDTAVAYNYPSDKGFVIGVKHQVSWPSASTKRPTSFNQISLRVGTGIANGGDGGGSKTFLTYGAPDLETNRFGKALSIAFAEHFLWYTSNQYAVNGYSIFTKSKGAGKDDNKAPDYFGRPVFNSKTDFAVGVRNTWFIKPWVHLLHELHFSSRKDGTQSAATLWKFSIAPTLVANSKQDVNSRPHFRFVYSLGKYNRFAANNLYSGYLQQSGPIQWAHYIGIKVEWWL